MSETDVECEEVTEPPIGSHRQDLDAFVLEHRHGVEQARSPASPPKHATTASKFG